MSGVEDPGLDINILNVVYRLDFSMFWRTF